jgi:CsoR family transcriptional regulator, copper-sensing transcriptional repressor
MKPSEGQPQESSGRQARRPRKSAADNPSKRVIQPHKATLLARLGRIAGQVRGISSMIDEDRYCVDILTQISAIQSALNAVSIQLLKDHTEGCVQAAIRSGHGEHAITELMDVVRRFAR